MRLDARLQRAVRALKLRGFLTPWLDAEVLLGHVLGVDRSYLVAHPERRLTRRLARSFSTLLLQRLRGQPVAYLLGGKEFYGRRFAVSPAVMIPRPETETIVAAVLNDPRTRRFPCRIADVGTGCGNLALTLALELPRATVHAVDASRRALRVARNNAKRLAAPVRFHHGDLLQPLRRAPLDIIVANLPYLDASIFPRTGTLRFEPRSALWSSERGLGHYRRLLEQLSLRQKLPRLTCGEMHPAQVPRFRAMARQLLPRLDLDVTVVNHAAFVSLTAQANAKKTKQPSLVKTML